MGNESRKVILKVLYMYVYYPPEVGSMKYCFLGALRKEYFRPLTK